VDGCSGECCLECFFELGIPRWPDLWQIALLDADGIPFAPEAWGEGDRVAHVARVLQRVADMRDVRALNGQRPWLF
jgi:hypothetical protein